MRCSKCNNEVDARVEFCPHCGRRVNTPPVRLVKSNGGNVDQPAKPSGGKSKAPIIILVVILAVIFVVAALAAAFMLIKGFGSSSDKVDVKYTQIEAGEEVDLNNLVSVKPEYADEYTVEPEGATNIIFKETGHTSLDYRLIHEGKAETISVEVDVVDTTGPSIEIIDNDIKEGDTFDIEDFVEVEDSVDGVLGGEYIDTDKDVDTDRPGDYDITVTAKDKSGNESSKEMTIEVTPKEGNESKFIQRITGLWLNGCQDASVAKQTAKTTGCTDVSMTEFVERGGKCYMTTIGDIDGQYDGDTVPYVSDGQINFTYISPDYSEAKGTVDGMEIKFDMGAPDDQVILYHCGGYYTHCAYTGFASERAMDSYFGIY